MRTKENKGVTLIALAVTIILMLILAGVTISTLMENSGITSNASLSKMMNELSKYKEVTKALKMMKLNVGEMHSDLEQAQREVVMHEFKAGRINILVATDIVARGIDIDDILHMDHLLINLSLDGFGILR